MRRRDGIPILLWLPLAAWFHAAVGGGGYEAAKLRAEFQSVVSLGDSVRFRVQDGEHRTEVDFDLAVPTPADEKADDEAKNEDSSKDSSPKTDEEKKKEKEKKKLEEQQKKKAEQEKKKDPPKPLPEEKKPPEPKKPEPAKVPPPEPVAAVPPPPPPPVDKRTPVQQHVTPNQEDNPTANQLGDEANHVNEETVARLTNHDRDDAKPTPGAVHNGPTDDPGNADQSKIGHVDTMAGAPLLAPGENGRNPNLDPPSTSKPATEVKSADATPKSAAGRGDDRAASASQNREPVAVAAGGRSDPAEIVSGAGGWSFQPLKPPGAARAAGVGAGGSEKRSGGSEAFLGLGAKGEPGRININLSHDGVVAALGEDRLNAERASDGERRRSEHRGSFQGASIERYKSAIENYVATVKVGNQTALNTAKAPFATYLVAIHNRIHPIFGESFLESLHSLPPGHPLANPGLSNRIEIVVSPKDGKVVRLGVVRTSGITAFDLGALDAVTRAQPFGPAPSAIVSPDGWVYLHWEFHNDETACHPSNARPFLLRAPGADPEPTLPPKGDPPDGERLFAPPPKGGHG